MVIAHLTRQEKLAASWSTERKRETSEVRALAPDYSPYSPLQTGDRDRDRERQCCGDHPSHQARKASSQLVDRERERD